MHCYNSSMPLRYATLLTVAIALFPLSSHAAAGFAPQSLFVSKESPAAGEEILIHATVFNSESKSVNGSVEFAVDGDPIGSQEFELATGEAKIISTKWKATSGEHQFNAYIDGTPEIKLTTSSSVKVTVRDEPVSQVQQLAGALSGGISSVIASSSPAVQSVANTIYAKTESWREAGLAYLSDALKDATTSPAIIARSSGATSTVSQGAVLGTSTVPKGAEPSDSSLFSGVRSATLGFLRVIFGTAAFFYPFFAILFFILLYVAKRTLIRPHRP